MLNADLARTVVVRNLIELLDDEDLDHDALTDDASLTDLGLTSLQLARLIIQLEIQFGADPFGEDLSVADVRTIGDLVAAYCGTPLPSGA